MPIKKIDPKTEKPHDLLGASILRMMEETRAKIQAQEVDEEECEGEKKDQASAEA